ncbi:phospho-sugar mutase [Alicyclobacillus cycloheptanicus]|nr:phospho-sugar mutase [Alicyclobacillus cycloheptanicus]
MERYRQWQSAGPHPEEIEQDLRDIAHDPAAIEERFYRDLAFGTGGLRGLLGAGTNRMNRYTVRKATAGLARYLHRNRPASAKQGVVIGYDCRRMSPEFALDAALVLAAQGIKAYLFDHLCPTPELSFAVRTLGAAAGVMVTASHNPPEYNGYKVYGPDGGQILPEAANAVTAEIQTVGDLFAVELARRQEAEADGRLIWVREEMDTAYVDAVVQSIRVAGVEQRDRQNLCIVYTPLHGTGNRTVRQSLAAAGYAQVYVVPEQEQPDGEFSTVRSPNPEEPDALSAAIALAGQVDADIVMGTDPDADRVGIAVRHGGTYRLLTGNQVGGLLVEFWLRHKQAAGTLPHNGIVFKTIVTSGLGAAVAKRYGVTVEDTLTGFKYIGAKATQYEQTGAFAYLFGYEESYGYLAAPIVRDKDAVQICLLIAEMAAEYKRQGQTLVDGLEALYRQVGYFAESLISVTLPGVDGIRQIASSMERLRQEALFVEGMQLESVEDYLSGIRSFVDGRPPEELTLPQENVIKYNFSNGSWLAVRPSGTEPKLKVYLGAVGDGEAACQATLERMKRAMEGYLPHPG